MSQQALGVRRSPQIVRLHRIPVSVVAALGFLAAAAFTVLNPVVARTA